ncbi:MAG: four helix bundle protein [Bacillota bacterium]
MSPELNSVKKEYRSIVQEKSFALAVKMVKYCNGLRNSNVSFVILNQVLKSSTSIGANVEEALGAQSDKDFIAKLYIVRKETRETIYWLRLISECFVIERTNVVDLIDNASEILRIVNSIFLTMKEKCEKNQKS